MTYREHMDYCRRRYFWELMARNGGDVRKIAQAAGMNRTHTYRLLQELGLNAALHRVGNAEWRAMEH